MRNMYRRTGLAAAGALAISMALTGPAHSDPKFVPDATTSWASVPTRLRSSSNDLANAFNKAKVGGTMRLASLDATGSATIVPRKGCDAITRPNGANAGIDELQANPDVSFARSSRGPNATGDEGTSFYPFATDKLSYVYAKPKSNVSLTLSAADLFDIYTCAKTDWSDFGMPAGHIEAKIPQAGSGTRSFFIAHRSARPRRSCSRRSTQPDDVCSVDEVQQNDPAADHRQPERAGAVLLRPVRHPAEEDQEEARIRRRRRRAVQPDAQRLQRDPHRGHRHARPVLRRRTRGSATTRRPPRSSRRRTASPSCPPASAAFRSSPDLIPPDGGPGIRYGCRGPR